LHNNKISFKSCALPKPLSLFCASPWPRGVAAGTHFGLKRVSSAKDHHCSQTCRKCVWNFHWGQPVEYQSMHLSALSTVVAARAGVVCCVLLMAISAPALAQNSATDNPSPPAAQDAVPAQQKPATAAEEKPAVADDKPAIAEQKPAPAEEKPVIAQEKPVAVEEKPAVAQDKPAAVEEKTAAVDDKPALVVQTATVPDAKPASAEVKPAAVEQKPAPAVETPAAAQQKPALKPKSAARRLAIADHGKAAEPGKPVQAAKSAQPAKPVQPAKSAQPAKPVQPAKLAKLAQPVASAQPASTAQKPRVQTMAAVVCTQFRTYNPSSKTYRGYDGQTHSCQ
jgi:hypothetical protein